MWRSLTAVWLCDHDSTCIYLSPGIRLENNERRALGQDCLSPRSPPQVEQAEARRPTVHGNASVHAGALRAAELNVCRGVQDGRTNMEKIVWSGQVVSVQPRIRLTRSFDERTHSYLGYCLLVEGVIDVEAREFSIGIGKGAHQKHQFQVGDEVCGESVPVADERKEPVEFYKTSKLKVLKRSGDEARSSPPWHGVPVDLDSYRARGHRRLSARTYESKCRSCVWGCRMPVVMIVDQWQPGKKRYRFETFCYGPKSCRSYKPGPIRRVPGRHGMVWEEPDWVDEEATAHRGPDE